MNAQDPRCILHRHEEAIYTGRPCFLQTKDEELNFEHCHD